MKSKRILEKETFKTKQLSDEAKKSIENAAINGNKSEFIREAIEEKVRNDRVLIVLNSFEKKIKNLELVITNMALLIGNGVNINQISRDEVIEKIDEVNEEKNEEVNKEIVKHIDQDEINEAENLLLGGYGDYS